MGAPSSCGVGPGVDEEGTFLDKRPPTSQTAVRLHHHPAGADTLLCRELRRHLVGKGEGMRLDQTLVTGEFCYCSGVPPQWSLLTL
jgi:hypothetical protein